MSNNAPSQRHEEMKDLRRRGEVKDLAHETDAFGSAENGQIQALAVRVFGSEAKAAAWLLRSNPSMSGQIPRDLLKDELGVAVVRETLEQIDNGIFA